MCVITQSETYSLEDIVNVNSAAGNEAQWRRGIKLRPPNLIASYDV